MWKNVAWGDGETWGGKMSLLTELSEYLRQLDALYKRRDELTREANELMIQEHNLNAAIRRVNIDLVQEVRRV